MLHINYHYLPSSSKKGTPKVAVNSPAYKRVGKDKALDEELMDIF